VSLESISEEINSIWAYIAMIIPDLFIIFYSLSTLMGSQAELLGKRFKRFKIDTVIIWLILSKVTYEFIRFFPYTVFEDIDFPLINALSTLNNDLINLLKNIAVLVFFLVLLIIIGIYEINKYAKGQRQLKGKVDKEIDEYLSTQPIEGKDDIISTKENDNIIEKTEIMKDSEEYNQDDNY
jgi:hypothetical protein